MELSLEVSWRLAVSRGVGLGLGLEVFEVDWRGGEGEEVLIGGLGSGVGVSRGSGVVVEW